MIYKLPYNTDYLNSLSKNMQIRLEQVQKAMENIQYALNFVAQAIKKIPESIKVLAENGWYLPIDFEPVVANRMAQHIKEGNNDIVDTEMIAYLDDKISNIRKQLSLRFPHRVKPINESFKAHRQGKYYLSIPVFFAQIEGICNELTGSRFFKLKKNQPETIKWLNNFKSDSILRMILEPLSITGVMRQFQDSSNPIGINRHDVLHGDCNDYGDSKINSYKVLSLLSYIGGIVYNAKKKLKTTKTKIP